MAGSGENVVPVTLQQLRGHRSEIVAAAARHGARRVRIFGSVARDEAGPSSDVDILVAFDLGRSLLDQVHLATDLEELLGVRVDVVAEGGLLPRDGHIVDEAVPI